MRNLKIVYEFLLSFFFRILNKLVTKNKNLNPNGLDIKQTNKKTTSLSKKYSH